MLREARRAGFCFRRFAADWVSGRSRLMVTPEEGGALEGASFPVRLSLEQRILSTDYKEAKIHNIRLAMKALENLPVPPGGILSFWRIVGRPIKARGFERGRSLLGGRLQPDYGGGLCQLSGVLYYLSLQGGLEILERHPHSVDIYDDNSRYAPLGADATVAYGFKDLRVRNNLPTPFCFQITLTSEAITGHLCSPVSVEASVVEFVRVGQTNEDCTVETRRRRPGECAWRLLSVSRYRHHRGGVE